MHKGKYGQPEFDREEVFDLKLSEDHLSFILCAINNYTGMGRERDEVLHKVKEHLSDDVIQHIRHVWGHVWDKPENNRTRRDACPICTGVTTG